MPGKRPRPFVRTSSIRQLAQSSPPSVAGVQKAPQRVVVGFDVCGAENSTKAHLDACESPRSVLEADALSDPAPRPHQPARSPRSPRSVLDRLLSGSESHSLCNPGVGLGIVAALGCEEPAMSKNVGQVCVRSNPFAVAEQNRCMYGQKLAFKERHTSIPPSYHANVFTDIDLYDDDKEEEDHDQQADGLQGSIFCAASPFSSCCSLDGPAGDFLSICAFCKCSLMPGKDIYMYRGDRAFCSAECRYQQIVIDELKERQPTASNCYPIVPSCSRFP